jgi:hypothetical protein
MLPPADGSALAAVKESELLGRRYGVQGTPAWFLAQRLISGLLFPVSCHSKGKQERFVSDGL